MKLYTRRGDNGETDLLTGDRTPKADPRVHAMGEVDETNAVIGLALCACESGELKDILTEAQSRLFDLGADLASANSGMSHRITQTQIDAIEKHIDNICARLPEMKHFILPGGTELAARLHLARTTCRRAERACVAINEPDPNTHDAIVYLNRLSDLLFALARLANQQANVKDIPWTGAQ